MQFTATVKRREARGRGAVGDSVLLSCLRAVQTNKKKTKEEKEKQKKTLFYAISIVKNFSNQKQKLTSKLATLVRCTSGEYPVEKCANEYGMCGNLEIFHRFKCSVQSAWGDEELSNLYTLWLPLSARSGALYRRAVFTLIPWLVARRRQRLRLGPRPRPKWIGPKVEPVVAAGSLFWPCTQRLWQLPFVFVCQAL